MTNIMIDGRFETRHANVSAPSGEFGMRVSRERMAENRGRILEEASRLFRSKGFDAVSVVEVMKAVGLTHGGFYGHFSSKDDLIAQSLAHVLAKEPGGAGDILAYLDAYLSPHHRDNAADGCPTAGLAADIRHQSEAVRLAMADGLRSQIDRVSAAIPGASEEDRRRAAIGTWAAMVGAVILARAVDDPALSNEVLKQTRAWIDVGINPAPALS